jgi:hypothetical protein
MRSRRSNVSCVTAMVGLLGAAVGARAQDGTSADVLADAVRDRGFACGRALAAERDEAASRPDEAVWILRCDDATYRVRFPGDQAPQVEPFSGG